MDVQIRRCVGSTRFGIEAHDAPASDFPVQPSRKDGLGVMCKPHWRQYTGALRKAALARAGESVTPETGKAIAKPAKGKPAKRKPAAKAPKGRAPKPAPPQVGKARTVKDEPVTG